jgi:hypothetical protein
MPGCASLTQIVKAIAVVSEKEDGSTTFALLLLRGDHELNEIKASKIACPQSFPFRHGSAKSRNTWAASRATSARRSIGSGVAGFRRPQRSPP